jgi:hypothetical protein
MLQVQYTPCKQALPAVQGFLSMLLPQEIATAMAAAIAAGPDSAASKGVAKATAAAICTGGVTPGTPAKILEDVWKVVIRDNCAGCTVLTEAHSIAKAQCKEAVASEDAFVRC